ncbi:MAG: SMI1/KNR4 family protein [Deltaproteobacteria bacterium]|nr:SMI1/KNR4 family protein [Deltaproteobacteria bacterium]
MIDSLTSLVPPPRAPTAAGGDVAAIAAALGTALPADWQALIAAYGYGTFADFLHLWSPFFAPCPMVEQARTVLAADRQLAAMHPKAVPFPLFPDRDGALPWANTDNGDVVYWLTWGEPAAWPVAVWNPRGGERYELFEGGAVAWLASWLGGARPCALFPRDVARAPVRFDPWRERVHATVGLRAIDDRGYDERLTALEAALAPAERRGEAGDDEHRQVHLAIADGAWRLTYDTIYGHNLRVAVPPADRASARAAIEAALPAAGLAITTWVDA